MLVIHPVHTLVNESNLDRFEFRPCLSSCNVRHWAQRRCRFEKIMTREEAREFYGRLLNKGWVRW